MATPQGMTTVTASNIKDANGQPLASGKISFTPVGNNGAQASAISGDGSFVLSRPIYLLVANGKITTAADGTSPSYVYDALACTPKIAYRLTFFDENDSEIAQPGYSEVQPTGDPWPLEKCLPNQPNVATVQYGPPGPAGRDGRDAISTTFNMTNISRLVPTAAAQNPLAVQANTVVDLNRNYFTDGTPYWSAGPNYASYGHYIDDGTLTMLANPAKFSAADVLNIFTKFVAARNSAGEFPIALLPSGVASAFYSAWDQAHKHATGDGWIHVPQLLNLYWQKTGDLTPYTANIAIIKTALALIPRNPNTHLVTVNPGDEYVSGMAFMEYMRLTGDVANASVWYAQACKLLGQMATAAGDSANASFFQTEYANVTAGIASTLIDSSSGLLIAATRQCSGNLDVVSSSLACFFEMLTPAQELKIAQYFDANYTSLVNAAGYILQSPSPWQVVGYIPASGGAPYTGNPSPTAYQGGFWSHHFAWFAYTLQKADPAKVATLLTTFLNGPDPATEWFNRGDATPQGTTPNLESPQGAALAMSLFPTPLVTTAGPAQFNRYGALISGGGSTTALDVSTITSSNTTGTRSNYTNSSGTQSIESSSSPYHHADLLLGSQFGTYAGGLCKQISGIAIDCTQVFSQNSARKTFMGGMALGWSATAGDPVKAQSVGFSFLQAGTLSLDTVSPGDGLGAFAGLNVGTQGQVASVNGGGGGLVILSNNARIVNGVESLKDTSSSAARWVLLQNGDVLIQTAPATTGAPNWDTVTHISNNGFVTPP